jgi:Zn-dependent M28 family amino/carboxypeptidase
MPQWSRTVKPSSIAIVLLLLNTGCGQPQATPATFDPEFKNNAYKHVESLAGFGVRKAGAESETRTARYLSEQFEKYGLDVTVERFSIPDKGDMQTTESCNIFASLPAPSPAESTIIISAHWDSIGGPGASDNASGIGVMLELARHFQRNRSQLSYNLVFLASGAEEIGWLGAKAYVNKHSDDLADCKLLVNIDSVGGSKRICIEQRGGVRNVSKRKGHLPSPLPPSPSCKPPWLPKIISGSMRELGYDYRPVSDMGSDHQVFASAAIPATNICIPGNKTHSPEDIAAHVNKDSLEKAGRIVATLVFKAMDQKDSHSP